MTAGIFVAGTDTGVGKTHVATALLRGLGRDGVRAAAIRPRSMATPSRAAATCGAIGAAKT